jgi:two-component system, LytTR family, sensor kinase
MKKNLKTIAIHALIWALYISYYIFHHLTAKPQNTIYFASWFVLFLSYIGLFYYQALLIMPHYYEAKKYTKMTIAILIGIVFFYSILYLRFGLRPYYAPSDPFTYKFDIYKHIFTYFRYFLVYLAYGTLYWGYHYIKRLNRLEKEALEKKQGAELSYLKTNINREFLMDILEKVQYRISTASETIATEIKQLTEMLEYSYSHKHDSPVALTEEIASAKKYVAINGQRFGDDTLVNFEIKGALQGFKIPHLTLVTLIENAIKHGALQKEPLRVCIEAVNDRVTIDTQNLKNDTIGLNSTHIGLKNLKARLSLVMHKKYTFSTRNDESYFYTTLNLQKP